MSPPARSRSTPGKSGRTAASAPSSSSDGPRTPAPQPQRSQRRSQSPDFAGDGQIPPAAPRAPGRTYRLTDEQRRKVAGVSRTLTYGEEDDALRTPTRRSTRTTAAQHTRTPPTFMLLASDLSQDDLLARKRLGSPIRLQKKTHTMTEVDDGASSVTSSTTPSPSRSFRSKSGRTRQKRGIACTDENAAPPKTDASPRRQQPKRTCTVGASSAAVKHAPNLLIQRSLSNAWPSRAVNAPMLRSTSDAPATLSVRSRQNQSPALCSPALSAGRISSSPSCFSVGQMDYFSGRSANSSSLAQAH